MSFLLIKKYFPELNETQLQQFEQLQALYEAWNEKINVISRKDMDNFYQNHVLHSLGIVKIMPFEKGSKVLDIGTGGGFPGIPLAIMFPDVQFTLIDSIGKKILVVNEVAKALGLQNVRGIHQRAEKLKEKFDFVVSRAVTAMPEFIKWLHHKFEAQSFNPKVNGVLYLKGGELAEELSGIACEVSDLKRFFEEDFFETKKVVYLSKDKIRV
jgi:16S rRNA (guanine527-N7)-methyltransferase